MSDEVILRDLEGVGELKAAEGFQRLVWGEDDPPDNSDILLAIQHEGGMVAGAFRGGEMLGFAFGFPTSDPRVQHSHRLAVHPDAQGLGLGRRLKWYQRDWCLQRGIETVRWTYDPLRRVNAGLNIGRLGAVARIYYKDYYGEMVGINAGVASDRLLAEWHLRSDGVTARAKGRVLPEACSDEARRVAIPADFGALLRDNLPAAIAERMRVREELVSAFEAGWCITGFDSTAAEYLLTR